MSPAGTKLAPRANSGEGQWLRTCHPGSAQDRGNGRINILRDLFEGLVTSGPKVRPCPASPNPETKDNKHYVFHLRKDAKWSTAIVTAHDFEFAFKRAVDPKTASPYSWYMGSRPSSTPPTSSLAEAVRHPGCEGGGRSHLRGATGKAVPCFVSMLPTPPPIGPEEGHRSLVTSGLSPATYVQRRPC